MGGGQLWQRIGFRFLVSAGAVATLAGSGARTANAAIIPVETNPFAPASQQVQAQFNTINSEILRLQLAGQTAAADAMRARLTHYQNQLNGTEASDGSGSELDIVECYQSPNGSTPGPASVHVAVTDRPVVLALGSYESVNWTLSIDPGVS